MQVDLEAEAATTTTTTEVASTTDPTTSDAIAATKEVGVAVSRTAVPETGV